MARLDEHVTGAVAREHTLDLSSAQDRRAIGDSSLGRATLGERAFERGGDLRRRRPAAHRLEREQPAAAIVDDAEQPHGHDRQHPDDREIEPPQLAAAPDADATALLSPRVLERDDEMTPTDHDLTEGLARRAEAEHAGGEPAQLARAEVRLLDMKAYDLPFDVVGRPVPRALRTRVTPRLGQTTAREPAPVQVTEPSAPATGAATDASLVIVNGDGESEQDADREETPVAMKTKQRGHVASSRIRATGMVTRAMANHDRTHYTGW